MRSQHAEAAQEEIRLTSLATCCARVGSAIDDFVRGQTSNKQQIHHFLKFLKMVQDQPGRPGESPEVSPETSFGSKTRFFRILKLRLFGHPGRLLAPRGLPGNRWTSPLGPLGLSLGGLGGFSKWGKALSSGVGFTGATSGRRAAWNNRSTTCKLSSVFIEASPK